MATRQRKEAVGDELHGESSGVVPTAEPSELSTTVDINKPIDGVIEVAVSTSFHVNLGNYESKDAFASAKARFADTGDVELQAAHLWDRVYATIAPELEMAASLTVHASKTRGDKEGTFIHLIVSE